jgi:hypothetical protein
MWVLVLTVQGCIKVLTASCECFYWLFMVVLRRYTVIQSWTVNTSTHMKLSTPQYNHEQSIKTLTWSCQHLNTTLNSQYKHSHETLTTLIRACIDCSGLYYGVGSFMRVLVLTVQDCITVLTVSWEFLYWLFRIVLRWCQYNHEQSIKTLTWSCQHLNTTLHSQYRHSHETLTTLIQSWTVNTSTHMKLSTP